MEKISCKPTATTRISKPWSKVRTVHLLTQSNALYTVPAGAIYRFGAANRRFPTGACAYLIPKNSVTELLFEAWCPTIKPLLVKTVALHKGAVKADRMANAAAALRKNCCILRGMEGAAEELDNGYRCALRSHCPAAKNWVHRNAFMNNVSMELYATLYLDVISSSLVVRMGVSWPSRLVPALYILRASAHWWRLASDVSSRCNGPQEKSRPRNVRAVSQS